MSRIYSDPLATVIKDLNILLEELEVNPSLSPWVISQVLKSIKNQAETSRQELGRSRICF